MTKTTRLLNDPLNFNPSNQCELKNYKTNILRTKNITKIKHFTVKKIHFNLFYFFIIEHNLCQKMKLYFKLIISQSRSNYLSNKKVSFRLRIQEAT